jgi:hypothetical protein
MVIPSKIVSNPNIALRIAEVIEEAVHVASVGIESIENERGLMPIEEGDVFATNKQEFNEMIKIYEHLKSSAENILLHLNHHLDNFSPFFGPSVINSTIVEAFEESDENNAIQYFSINDSFILAFIEIPDDRMVRILVRNAAGKYVWDFKTFYHNLDEINGDHSCREVDIIHTSKLPRLPTKLAAASSDSIESPGSDPIEQTVIRINSDHPECLYLLPDVESPAIPATEFLQLIHQQVENELLLSINRTAPIPIKEHIPKRQRNRAFEMARLFLAQTGQLSFDHLKEGKLQMLVKSASLMRDIKGLDKQYS